MELGNGTVTRNPAVMSLIAEVARGIEMIEALDDTEYAIARNGESSIGAHIRHNLDFLNAFLKGIEIGRIDYNGRERDPQIESDSCHATEQMRRACRRLKNLSTWIIGSLVLVRSEIDAGVWHTSSALREIEFLHSHTVHHYALIKLLLEDEAPSVNTAFGVSPSTLRYRSEAQLRNYGNNNYEIN